MADGKLLPKAGCLPKMGKATAEQIAAQSAGKGSESSFTGGASFTGKGYCYLEGGGDQAMMIKGQSLAEPAPQVTEASPQNQQEKRGFAARQLQDWLLRSSLPVATGQILRRSPLSDRA